MDTWYITPGRFLDKPLKLAGPCLTYEGFCIDVLKDFLILKGQTLTPGVLK